MLRYAITDRTQLGGTEEERRAGLVEQSVRLARSGVDLLQLREKDLLPGELAAIVRRVLEGVRAAGGTMKVLVNSRVDDASSIGGDGIHLSVGAFEAWRKGNDARTNRGDGRGIKADVAGYVSVACHSVEEVQQAREARVDAVLFGPVFGKTVRGLEVGAGVGLERLREACVAAGKVGVFALGGVTEENAEECVRAGAVGVAGIRMFLGRRRPRNFADERG